MDSVELLVKFADPDVMKTLSISERFIAGLITTVLGMGITFFSLVVLQFVMILMAKLSGNKVEEVPAAVMQSEEIKNSEKEVEPMKDEELVAALSVALAMKLKTSVGNIVIRNIERVEDTTPVWSKAGLLEQLNDRV
jgi:glutaconyl-CoA/methylmalonyl-CoA decarboxylase subunit delta